MQRLTVFFIGAGITITAVTAGLLGIKYTIRHNPETVQQPAVIQETQLQTDKTIVESEKSQITSTPELIAGDIGDKDTPRIVDMPSFNPFASINREKVQEAGFLEPSLELSAFSGTVFQKIDFSEYDDDQHIQYQIFEKSLNAGLISELIFPDGEIADNVYEILKNIISDMNVFIVNETNQYGDKSFFANNEEEKNSVFLVVKNRNRLYTFHYPARNHNKMKNLIGLL